MQAGWATGLWPVAAGRLSNIFVASIFAAIGGPLVWIGATGDTRALLPGSADLAVNNFGFAAAGAWFYGQSGSGKMGIFALGTGLLALICLAMVVRLWHLPYADRRPTPKPLRAAFAVFALLLAFVAARLILQVPNTFPWPLGAENSVFYGCIFSGAMVYFLFGLIQPVWGNAGGQMVGFLLYDLVLIVPFIGHFGTVQPEMLLSLAVYTTVVSASGLIAIWYLFLDPATRFGIAAPRPSRGLIPAAPEVMSLLSRCCNAV